MTSGASVFSPSRIAASRSSHGPKRLQMLSVAALKVRMARLLYLDRPALRTARYLVRITSGLRDLRELRDLARFQRDRQLPADRRHRVRLVVVVRELEVVAHLHHERV